MQKSKVMLPIGLRNLNSIALHLDVHQCHYENMAKHMADESKPRKRGRPFKSKPTESPLPTEQNNRHESTASAQTPQSKRISLPQSSPTQATTPKSTPTGKSVKALPMARDHTTDQLTGEGDEYITREHDEAGEKKVTATGHLTDGRAYRCRTFYVPNRGKKLFMLATECARVLSYRDSYLLFNKNRSLVKIIANQQEKEELISQEILPYSYRSRQIAIVTAKSMYRQFGARIIVNGRRVKDDYWEYKARKQGFTEEDLASEKRPTTNAKPKENTGDTTNHSNSSAANLLAGTRVEYDNKAVEPHFQMAGQFAAGGFMTDPLSFVAPDDMRRDYGNVQRPRQDITGTPYQDRLQSSATPEIINQAAQTAEYNKWIAQQRGIRGQYLDEAWNRRHEVETLQTTERLPAQEPQQHPQAMPQIQASPVQNVGTQPPVPSGNQTQMMQPRHRRSSSAMMNPQVFAQQTQQPNSSIPQSPAQRVQQTLPPGQMPPRQPNYAYNAGAIGHNPNMYGYIQNMQNQMWHPPGPQSSPLAQHHNLPGPQYQHPQQSPHLQHSPHHPPAHPQMHHGQQSGPGGGGGGAGGMPMGYQGMGGMHPQAGYPHMNRSMYQQPGPSNTVNPQHFMHQASQPGGMWPPMASSSSGASGPGWQQRY